MTKKNSMKEKTLKDDPKRLFEAALDIPGTLHLQPRGEVSQQDGKSKSPSPRKKFSGELLSRIVECIEEL